MTMPQLSSDCSRCFGLCCVLLPFSAVSGFGVDKPGGVACHHLRSDDSCGIHATLRADGWRGCTVFECFGAGQQVSQVTYQGVSWREQQNLGEMAAVLSVVRQLHEMLLHLRTARERTPDPAAGLLTEEIAELVSMPPDVLLGCDLDGLHDRVGTVLRRASVRVRRGMGGTDLERADLAGADLAGADLRGATLRGSVLIRAGLSGADLEHADLLGADLRDADLRGARLRTTLFLTQPQLDSAVGDDATELPDDLVRPAHWE